MDDALDAFGSERVVHSFGQNAADFLAVDDVDRAAITAFYPPTGLSVEQTDWQL